MSDAAEKIRDLGERYDRGEITEAEMVAEAGRITDEAIGSALAAANALREFDGEPPITEVAPGCFEPVRDPFPWES